MVNKFWQLKWLAVGAVLVVSGAGCSQKPTTSPGYLQDAADFEETTEGGITSTGSLYQKPGEATTIGLPAKTTPPATTTKPVAPKPATSTKEAPGSAPTDYLKLLSIYKTSGLYIQFTACHGLPGTLSVKKGAKVMLDNRDAVGHTLGFEGRLYGLGSYRSVLVTPLKVGTQYITCDGGGSAQLNVQP
ncbi:MAG: hypothetical protein Q7K39_02965 [Candidatus Magasanikbacteria bacterium]|nr:hypothetical protein [Candidatus Magasanikbacteria bacterium]